MAQRSIEILVGRLITDEAVRTAFLRDAEGALGGFMESGLELTSLEIAALKSTPATVWARLAEGIDPRLQKAALSHNPHTHPAKRGE